MVRVRAIGATEVRVGRRHIGPDSMVLFALALYLACTAGARIARQQLLDLLWPGVPQLSRRHALRQLLYRLRQSGLVLAHDGEELQLEAANVDSDLASLLAAGWPESAPPDEIVAAATVLPGYTPPLSELYREWLDELRARIAAQYRRAVLRQIACARQEGRWFDLDSWARRCLAVDPFNEEGTLARAEAMARTGAKTAALGILNLLLAENVSTKESSPASPTVAVDGVF